MPLLSQDTTDGTPLLGLNPESNKRVLASCDHDQCGVRFEVSYKSYLAKQREYRRNGETYCRKCASVVSRGKRRLGPSKTARATGARNANFRGGKFVNQQGYVMVLVAPGAYQREDLLAVGYRGYTELGSQRLLHIDQDKTNSARDNLILFDLPATRFLAEKSLGSIAIDLLRRGLVAYDRSSNTYVQTKALRDLRSEP